MDPSKESATDRRPRVPRQMPPALGRIQLLAVGVAMLVALASCGGSGSTNSATGAGADPSGGGVVASVGANTVTKDAVDHWMRTLAGGDYYEVSAHHTLPEGLVSEPASYGACVARLEAMIAVAPKRMPGLTGTTLLTKCRELYQSLRAQATAFLVKVPWLLGSYRDIGITVSEAEVLQFFKRFMATHLHSEAELPSYLAQRHLTTTDELLVLKLDLLAQKAQSQILAGGQTVYNKLLVAENAWTEKTSCSTGYVVERCRQYHGGSIYGSNPSPAILMEQLAAIALGRCTNVAACGKL